MATLTGNISNHPVSYDSDRKWNAANNTANGYTDSSSTNYCQVNLTMGQQAETMVNWNFGSFTDIPEGATIDTVICTCKCMINNTTSNRVNIHTAQLYTGSTAKGTAYSVTTTVTEFSIVPGTWTREELLNAKLRLYAKRGNNYYGTGYYFRFYGATLIVGYSYEGVSYNLKVKSNGSWVTPSKVLVKNGGVWKEPTGISAKYNGAWKNGVNNYLKFNEKTFKIYEVSPGWDVSDLTNNPPVIYKDNVVLTDNAPFIDGTYLIFDGYAFSPATHPTTVGRYNPGGAGGGSD